MKGNIVLSYRENSDELRYNFYVDVDDYEYTVGITINPGETYLSLLDNTEELEIIMDFGKSFITEEDELELHNQCLANVDNLIKDAESVTLMFDLEECHKYLEENPELKSKKIILGNITDLSADIIDKIKSLFGDYASQIHFKMTENKNIISFDEYCETIKIIDSIANEIDSYNLSLMEKIMYAYDIVRNKLYVAEDETEAEYVSRDLSSSLLGNKIVCLGYARIFKTILERLNIPSNIVYLDSTIDGKNGHARNEIYIKDDKYGIDGIYFFDATWDRKKRSDDNRYLLSYKFFCVTKDKMDEYDHGELIDKAFPYYSEELADEFMETDLDRLSPDMVKSINHMGYMINGHHLINRVGLPPYNVEMFKPDKEKVYRELKPMVEYYNRPITADVLLEVLYNVRKLQYYKDPSIYPFSLEDFYKTVVLSGWQFASTPERMLLQLFGIKEDKNRLTAAEVLKYSKSSELDKRIEQIKLTKTLRLSYDKRVNE